ncbi:uncharacterized protein MELLADRAFT_124036 [Melampsora larici-populina 98AG31]|uniref:Secreted protein n=1 Tax=Melampsora larici-populina (strain 98AG31 / pathotype 3-4-7) TaxID=747676 RepID=F4RHA5_MELLP|nr:uncharacterized protein MELLADRAFT_124036 [Melampsora larici-populina 98AG31]EGG08286.1 secreted protein [Melampsora larici-populina 98AG31]
MLAKIAFVLLTLGFESTMIAEVNSANTLSSSTCHELFSGTLKNARCVSGGIPGTEINYHCSDCHGVPPTGQWCLFTNGAFPNIGIPNESTVFRGERSKPNVACANYKRVYRGGKSIGFACSLKENLAPTHWCNALNAGTIRTS